MSTQSWLPLLRHATVIAAVAFFAIGSANAQFSSSLDSSSTPSVSESSSSQPLLADASSGMAALPAAPSPAEGGAAGGQYGGRYKHRQSMFSHLAFEVGGGFNAPTNESSPYITWGGNLTVGAGYRFNPYLSLMTEYQFIADKLPGALIAETGAQGGHAHIWSLTLDPVVDLFPHSSNSIYVTGGGGFYRKVTSFTNPAYTQYCSYFYCYPGVTNVVVGHFSSNQGGWNVGAGYSHRLGGLYGDSRMKLFAEARYLDVMSPAVTTQPNGLGTTTVGPGTKIIPVTFGIRW
ncbi:MAG: outer membrane beta-barrel protein [Acidobacteriota bacterium]|nr:outer membrane beta-barrel protein [Acidobacteriota bacterium]